MLAPFGVQAPPGERHAWAELQLRWSGGEHQVRLHLHFTAAAAAAAAEAQKLKKQAVWVRMHLEGRRGRERVVHAYNAHTQGARMYHQQQQGRAWQPWGAREPGGPHSQCEGQGQGQGP